MPRAKKEKKITAKAIETGRTERVARMEKGKERSYDVEAVTKAVEARAEEMLENYLQMFGRLRTENSRDRCP